MTPAMAELIHHHRKTISDLDEQIRLMESHQRGEAGFGTRSGNQDTTAESLESAARQRERLQDLVDKHDPEGFTKLV